MKKMSIAAAALSLLAFGSAWAYQVTGPVTEITDKKIVVMKGKEKFEIARDATTKLSGDVKVGSKVTVYYSMTATDVEVKGK